MLAVGTPDGLSRSIDIASLSSRLAVRAIDRETRRLDAIERGELGRRRPTPAAISATRPAGPRNAGEAEGRCAAMRSIAPPFATAPVVTTGDGRTASTHREPAAGRAVAAADRGQAGTPGAAAEAEIAAATVADAAGRESAAAAERFRIKCVEPSSSRDRRARDSSAGTGSCRETRQRASALADHVLEESS